MIKGNLILPKVQIENDAKETVKEKQCGIACLNYFCFHRKNINTKCTQTAYLLHNFYVKCKNYIHTIDDSDLRLSKEICIGK